MSAFALVGLRLVDGRGGEPIDETSVTVSDGLITAIGDEPAGVQRIDCSGLTLTPGLIDAHVHLGLSSDINASFRLDISVAELAADVFNNCAQTLDAGFTTVRDAGGIDGGVARVVASGKVRGPRILQSGPIQCQTGGHGHFAAEWEPTGDWSRHDIPGLRCFALLSDGADELRKNVREAFRRGADFIKLCATGGIVSTHDRLTDTQFTSAEIAVAVEEAVARGTYVTVHAHNNEGVRNAVRAGVRCVEHGSAIDEETAALMARHDVAHVPTLAVIEMLAVNAESSGLSPTISGRVGMVRQGQVDALRVSKAAGVRVGLGSDLIGPDQSNRGDELLLRARVESPMEALVAATSVNAGILGIEHEVGTVEVGKRADLVAFSSDPLEDPTVFASRESVVVVVKDGRLVKDCREG